MIGYACGGPYMTRAADRWSAMVSAYLDGGHPRTGGGRTVYGALFQRVADRGIRTVIGWHQKDLVTDWSPPA